MTEITMIPIEKLAHHPENPRLELGDLTELTNSIRANGIMQNLTVVFEPEHTMSNAEWVAACEEYNRNPTDELRTQMNAKRIPDRYLVVIGNRRFEASKAAGLKELPCVISDMDHNQQIATMLQENMQRSDLTIYEQARGIQMMLDLGFAKDEVQEKTGLSKTTIERRIAVASLPKDETKQAVARGFDLLDLLEISKLENKEAQEKLLKVGTDGDFSRSELKQKIISAQRHEQREKIKKKMLTLIKEFATEMTTSQSANRYGNGWEHLNKYDVKLEDGAKVIRPKAEGNYYFYESWGTIEIWQKVKQKKCTKTPEEIAIERRQQEAKELNARMRENRIAFCASWNPTKKEEAYLKEELWKYVFDNVSSWCKGGFRITYHIWDNNKFRAYCGMPLEQERDPEESILHEIERRGIPMGRAILAWIMCGGVDVDCRPGYAGEYRGEYNRDNDLDETYEILMDNGYTLTDEEEQWKDGTHPFFQTKIKAKA